MNRILIVIPFVTLACTGASTDSGAANTGNQDCDTTVDATWPENGAADFYFRDAIEFTLSDPDPSAEVIFSRSGSQSTSDDGLTVIFTPDQPLPPSTEFEAALDYCYGSPTIEFSTSELGEDLENPLAIAGKTYRVDLADARYTENPGVAGFLMGWLNRDLLFHISDIQDGALSLRLALAGEEAEDGQDLCYRTFDIEGMTLEGPDLVLSADDILFDFYTGSLQVGDFDLVATLASDLSWLGGAQFSGWLNITDFSAALDLNDDEDICDIMDNLDSGCEPCPHDSTQSCVTLAGDRLEGVEVGVELVEISEQNSFPGCPGYDEPS
jgi:hypothetical protein